VQLILGERGAAVKDTQFQREKRKTVNVSPEEPIVDLDFSARENEALAIDTEMHPVIS
jgi:hypothetical protein